MPAGRIESARSCESRSARRRSTRAPARPDSSTGARRRNV